MVAFAAGALVAAGREGEPEPEPPDGPLPGGAERILPGHRVIALYGAPQDPALGALGVGTPGQAATRIRRQAEAYDRDTVPAMPAFELIATVANSDPGDNGLYNTPQPASVIRRYLKLARENDALLLLDVQPGRGDFMTEVERLSEFLREPEVGLALDPEWSVGPVGVPGQEIGSVDAAEVNEVSEYLQTVIDRDGLPQKLLVVHQFTDEMIEDKEELTSPPDVAVVLNADGFGDQPNKVAKYRALRPWGPIKQFPLGFKLFYQEDYNLMTPAEVLGLRPPPDFIVYE